SVDTLYGLFDRQAKDALRVDGPKSAEHEFIRDSLIPSLLQSLSRNVHEEYPQRLFEIGKVFQGGPAIREDWAIATVVAHGDAGYTEIKSYLQALLKSGFGKSCQTASAASPFFIPGRSANILIDGRIVGSIGEIVPLALENLRMRVPVSAFEIDLGRLLVLPQ
ncbi:MAG: phenylalanine--tRNA ligase subunit beta, partial [Nitrososphaera sp.]